MDRNIPGHYATPHVIYLIMVVVLLVLIFVASHPFETVFWCWLYLFFITGLYALGWHLGWFKRAPPTPPEGDDIV